MTILEEKVLNTSEKLKLGEVLRDQADTYRVDTLVDEIESGKWDPFAPYKAAKPAKTVTTGGEPKVEVSLEEKNKKAKAFYEKWLIDEKLLLPGETLTDHEVEYAKIYHFHWVVKNSLLMMGKEGNDATTLPWKPSEDGKGEIAAILRWRMTYNQFVPEVCVSTTDLPAVVASWESQLGVNGSFRAAVPDMILRMNDITDVASVDALDRYMQVTLPKKSLMKSRDKDNWEAAAMLSVIQDGLTVEEAKEKFMLGRTMQGLKYRVSESLLADGYTAENPPVFTEDGQRRQFYENRVRTVMQSGFTEPDWDALKLEPPKAKPPSVKATKSLIEKYQQRKDISDCYGANARLFGRMVITDYYVRRTEDLAANIGNDRVAVARRVMAETVCMTMFRCLPGTDMMTNIQSMDDAELFGLVDRLTPSFQQEIEELDAKRK